MSIITNQFKLSGLSCGHCAAAVEQSVSKIGGVKKVKVDLAGSAMSVDYEPEVANLAAIERAVKNAGYNVVK